MDKEIEDLVSKFRKVGYSTSEDVEHLKEVTEQELKMDIGIKKPGALCLSIS